MKKNNYILEYHDIDMTHTFVFKSVKAPHELPDKIKILRVFLPDVELSEKNHIEVCPLYVITDIDDLL